MFLGGGPSDQTGPAWNATTSDFFKADLSDSVWGSAGGRRNLKLEFFWAPEPNPRLVQLVRKWADEEGPQPPDILVLGCGLRTVANITDLTESQVRLLPVYVVTFCGKFIVLSWSVNVFLPAAQRLSLTVVFLLLRRLAIFR